MPSTETLPGVVITGAVVSFTITLNDDVPALLAASYAVHVTVLVPSGKPHLATISETFPVRSITPK